MILKFHILILILIISFSLTINTNIFTKKSKSEILSENEKAYYPNVIMISLDAVRSDHLSCYGYKRKTSPNIDRMAAEGVLFENAFANSSHTRESVPSLFSSTYPSTHNVIYYNYTIPDAGFLILLNILIKL